MPAGDAGLRELRARVVIQQSFHVKPDGHPPHTLSEGAWTAFDMVLQDIDRLLAASASAVAAPAAANAGLRFRANVHAGTCSRAAQLDQQTMASVPVEIMRCMGLNRSCRCVLE
jgi:hypothetical protein